MFCLGNEKKKYLKWCDAPAVFSFSEGFVPFCDHIVAEQYAVSEKEMWRLDEV